jgi:hypothetical protein
MKSQDKIMSRLIHAIKWRDTCKKENSPGYPFWDREAHTLKWVLNLRSEKTLRRKSK